MSVRNLDKIFRPASIAVIGASDDRSKVGFTVLKNLIAGGFSGALFPVNSRREVVQGLPAFPRIGAIPQPPDLAIVCTPASGVPNLVAECGETGTLGIVILSAGFREFGAEGAALEQKVRETWRKYDGMRIIGPNCLGVISPISHLNASFAADGARPGRVALISQSGALCTSLLDWAVQEQIGFSHFVSVGNMLDVGFGDLIDYFGADSETRSMILYVESIRDARGFMSAARAFARTKPIVAYKAGRFTESAKAAASHTGAMAGEDAVCNAAFQRAGIERAFSIEDMFDYAELLCRARPPRGDRLAILTNAGGPGVMATDALISQNGTLASLSKEKLQALSAVLPPSWSHSNPIDILGDATPDRFSQTTELLLTDRNVDALLVILTPQSMTDPSETAANVAEIAAKSSKPVLAAWVGGHRVHKGRELLMQAGVPTYATPERAVNAFMHLVSYAHNLEALYETPRAVPLSLPLDRKAIHSQFAGLLQQGDDILSEGDSKSLLAAYGIPIVATFPAATAEEAVQCAQRIGFPVALKVLSRQITHKTDVGGVALGLHAAEGVRAAYEQIVKMAKTRRPDAEVDGVTVQRMITAAESVELIVGMKKDVTFGAVLMVGAGGITAELYRDRALGLPPLNERLARRMVESLRIWPLLQGYRGRKPVDIDLLIQVLMKLSDLVANHPEIEELDVNPLLVTASEIVALDARIVIDRQWAGQVRRPFSHLAIRPYPEEYVRSVRLSTGAAVTLRPIRSEDEPLWHQFINACSVESLHARFQHLFKGANHQLGTRFCCIDYDRELALICQIDATGEIAGVARLVADPDHETAEFAILIADAWQGIGMGILLTNNCLDVARQWGIRELTGVTLLDNIRMISLFEGAGFKVEPNLTDGLLMARRSLVGQ